MPPKEGATSIRGDLRGRQTRRRTRSTSPQEEQGSIAIRPFRGALGPITTTRRRTMTPRGLVAADWRGGGRLDRDPIGDQLAAVENL